MLKGLQSKTAQKRVMRAGVRTAAANTKKVMKSNMPKDEGDLRISVIIVIRNKGYRFTANVGAGDSYSRADGKHPNGKTPYFYDHLANEGYETRDGRSIPGSHYVERTADATKSQNQQIMMSKAIVEIDKLMAKGVGK
ncbi:MAG TPA: hypothetical protein VF598_01695 [Hymenobacter sp.]